MIYIATQAPTLCLAVSVVSGPSCLTARDKGPGRQPNYPRTEFRVDSHSLPVLVSQKK